MWKHHKNAELASSCVSSQRLVRRAQPTRATRERSAASVARTTNAHGGEHATVTVFFTARHQPTPCRKYQQIDSQGEVKFTVPPWKTRTAARWKCCMRCSSILHERWILVSGLRWKSAVATERLREKKLGSQVLTQSLFVFPSHLCEVCLQTCWALDRYFIWQQMREDFSVVDGIKSRHWLSPSSRIVRVRRNETKAKGTVLKHQSNVHYFIKGE